MDLILLPIGRAGSVALLRHEMRGLLPGDRQVHVVARQKTLFIVAGWASLDRLPLAAHTRAGDGRREFLQVEQLLPVAAGTPDILAGNRNRNSS